MTLEATFTFNGATVTVQKPNAGTKVKLWMLRQALRDHGTGGVPIDVANAFCYHLANTVKVEGSLGFPVPVDAPTHNQLIEFLKGYESADEELADIWDNAIYDLKYASNDPDLLPPHEIDEKKSAPLKSSSKG